MTSQLFLWSFSTIILQLRVLATAVDFTAYRAKTQLLYPQLFESSYSFLLSMRPIILCKIVRHSQLNSSDLYLNWTSAKIFWIHKLCQGKFLLVLVHTSSFQQLTCTHIKLSTAEAYETIFIWSILYRLLEHLKFPNLLPLTIGAGVGLLVCILYFFQNLF